MSTTLDAKPQPSTQKQTTQGGGSGGASPQVPVSRSLRQLSYKDGEAALAPSGPAAESIAASGFEGPSASADPGIAGAVQKATGVDVSHARHHTGPKAAAACKTLGAEAYTVGPNVAFAGHNPKSATVAHEYAHVAQQTGVGDPAAQGAGSDVVAPSGDLEGEADAVAGAVGSGGSARVSLGQAPSVRKKEQSEPPPNPTPTDQKDGQATTSNAAGTNDKKSLPPELAPPPWVDNDVMAAKLTHMPELQSIIRHLKGPTHGSDVTAVLQTLSHWDLATIDGAWRAINDIDSAGNWLGDILGSIGLDHIKAFPREVIGTLRAARVEWRYDKLCDLTDSGFLNSVTATEAAFAHAILKELPQAKALEYAQKYPSRAKDLYTSLPADARRLIDNYFDPKKEKELRDREKKNRVMAAEEQAYLGKASPEKKKAISGNIAWLKDKMSGNWIGALTESAALEIFTRFMASMAADPSGVELRLLCREVEQTSHMDRLLDKIPGGAKYTKGIGLQTFLHICRNRPPEFALVTAEKLLSYGLFDWAITDTEARLAYDLIRMQPPGIQKRFREKDGGKWLARMETHLGLDVVKDADQMTLDEKGALVKGQFGTVSSEVEGETLKKQEDAYKKHLEEVEAKKKGGDAGATDLFSQLYDKLKDDKLDNKKALSAMFEIVGIEVNLRGAIVRRLDAAGLVELMIKHIGNDLWTEANAPKTLALLVARDPMRAVEHVRRLVQEGRFFVLKWIDGITPEEGKLAFNLIRALPPEYRQLIRDKFPAWEGEISAAMGRKENGQSTHNLYEGGKDQADRMSILSQLSSAALWENEPQKKDDKAATMNLEQVIRMASAAGHRKIVFETAKKLGKLDSHRAILVATKIVDDKGQFLDKEPVGDFDRSFGSALGEGIKVGGSLLGQALGGQAVLDTEVDLSKIQDITSKGTLGGARFKKDLSEEDKKKGVNKVSLAINQEMGRIDIDIPALQLDEFRTMVGDIALTTGPVSTGKVSIRGQFPTPHKPETPTEFIISIDDPTINDLMVVMPAQMVAVKKIGLKSLSVNLAEIPNVAKDAKTPEDAKKSLTAIMPAQSFFIPIWKLLPSLLNFSADLGDNVAKGPGGAQIAATGLVMEGVAHSGGAHAGEVKVDKISLDTNNLRSKYAESQLKILQARLETADARLAAIKGKTDKIDVHERERLEKEKIATHDKIADIRKELPTWQKEDLEYLDLYKKQKAGQPFTEPEAKRFKALQEQQKTGVTLDVSGISAKGVGTLAGDNEGSVDIGRITATGQTNALGIGFIANPVAAAQVGKGGPPPGPDDKKAGTKSTTVDGDVQISTLSAKNLTIGGAVPDYRQQDKQKKDLEARGADALGPAEVRTLSGLQTLWAKKVSTSEKSGKGTYGEIVQALLSLEQKGLDVLQLNPDLLAERERMRGLLRVEAATIGSVDVRGISLGAKSSTVEGSDGNKTDQNQVGMSIGELEIKDVESGNLMSKKDKWNAGIKDKDKSSGKGVKSISAMGVSGAASISALTDIATGDQKTKLDGTVGIESMHMEEVRTGTGQATIGSVDIQGAQISASNTEGGGKLSIQAKSIEARAIRIPPKIDGLKAELEELAGNATPTEAQKLRVAEIKAEIQRLDELPGKAEALKVKIAELEKKKKSAKTKKDKEALGQEILDLQKEADKLMAEYNSAMTTTELATKPGDKAAISMQGASVTATGLGDFMDKKWDLDGKTIDIDVGVPDFQMSAFHMQSPKMTFGVTSAAVSGFKAQVSVAIQNQKDPKTGQVAYGVKPTMIKLVQLDSVACTGLTLDMPIGSEVLELGVPKADLKGITVKSLPLGDEIDPAKLSGSFSIDQGKADISAKLGKYFSAGGRVNVAERLSVDAFDNGDVKFNPGNLNLEEFGFRVDGDVPKGSMVEKLKGAGGKVNLKGLKTNVELNRQSGKMKVKGPLGTLSVNNVSWGGGGRTLGLTSAALENVDVDADVELDPVALGAKMDGKYKEDELVKSWKLNRLSVGRISGAGLKYKGDGVDVSLVSGALNNIVVTNFQSGSKAGQVAIGKDKQGKGGPAVELNGLSFVQGGISLSASAKIDSINVESASDGKITTNLANITGQVKGKVDGNDIGTTTLGDGKGGQGANIDVSVMPDGKISTGFSVPTLRNSGFKWTTGGGTTIDLTGGSAGLTGVTGKVDYTPKDKDEKGKPKAMAIDLDLGVKKADVENAKVKSGDLSVGMPSGAINGIYAKGFHLDMKQVPGKNPGDPPTWAVQGMTGKAGISSANLTNAAVTVPQLLTGQGSLNTGALSIDFLSKDDMKFDLDWIRLHPADAKLKQFWAIAGGTAVADASITGKKPGDKAVSGSMDKNGGLTVDVGKVEATVDANAKGGTMPGKGAEPGKPGSGKMRINLKVLDTLNGGFSILFPGGMAFGIPFQNGRLIADLSKVPELINHPLLDWVPGGMSTKLTRMVVGEMVKWLDGKLQLRPRVEKAIVEAVTGPTAAKAATDPATFQSMLEDIVSGSVFKAAAIDAFTSEGKGVMGTIGDELGNLLLKGWDAAKGDNLAKHHRELLTQERVEKLRTWLGKFGVSAALKCDGPFDGDFVPDKGDRTDFSGNLGVNFGLGGSLADGVKATLKLGSTNLKVIHGDTVVKVESVGLDANALVQDKNKTLQGGGGAKLVIQGTHLEKKGGAKLPPAPGGA